MRHFHLTRQKYFKPTINVDRLWSLLPEDARMKMLKTATRKQAPVIDCVRAVRSSPVFLFFCLFLRHSGWSLW